jgi:carbonic anhydrase/acetyltransferase-like protein (isoleucine patch superfamily)
MRLSDFPRPFPSQATSTTQKPAPTSTAQKEPQSQPDLGPKYEVVKSDVKTIQITLPDGTTKTITGKRIRAVRDIGNGITNGTLGGYIHDEGNLSQDGTCWVDKNVIVSGNVRITDDAQVLGTAIVVGPGNPPLNSKDDVAITISGEAIICDNAQVVAKGRGKIQVTDKAQLDSQCKVFTNDNRHGVIIDGQARITEFAVVTDNATVTDTLVGGAASLRGNVRVDGHGEIMFGNYYGGVEHTDGYDERGY